MEMVVKEAQGSVPVTILRLNGALDGSNYTEVINKGKALYDGGARRILVDMSGVPFMSSAGLVALHVLVLILRGEEIPDLESGWGTMRAVERDSGSGKQPYLKLLKPQERIARTLDMSGMSMFIDIFSDEGEAIASFS